MTTPDSDDQEKSAREARLEQIRKAIEAGEYDTEEMMDRALRKFLEQNDG